MIGTNDKRPTAGRLFVGFILLCLTLWPACAVFSPSAAPHQVDADLVGPLMLDVCERHDHYVMADDRLSVQEKEVFFRSSEIVRRAIAESRPELPAEPTPPGR